MRHHVTASANTAGVSPSDAHSRYRAQRSTSPARVSLRGAPAGAGEEVAVGRWRRRYGGYRPGDRGSRRAGAPDRSAVASANHPVRRKGVSARTTRPSTWGMRRKGAPTQASSSSTARGTTAGSPAPATSLLDASLGGEVVDGEQPVAVRWEAGHQRLVPAETGRHSSDGAGRTSRPREERLARQAGRRLADGRHAGIGATGPPAPAATG